VLETIIERPIELAATVNTLEHALDEGVPERTGAAKHAQDNPPEIATVATNVHKPVASVMFIYVCSRESRVGWILSASHACDD